jgi:DCN1-like protein 4/5
MTTCCSQDLTKMSSRTQPPLLPKSYERYNAARAVALFQKYADPDDPNVIGPEGFTQLCEEARIPMDGALPLILAWQLQAMEMGKFTREEWIGAMSTLQ